MTDVKLDQFRPTGARRVQSRGRVLAILCFILLTVFASLIAVHFHPDLSKSAVDNCLLCQTAHATTLSVTSAPAIEAVSVPVSVIVLPAPRQIDHTPAFTLNIRPPPAV